MTTLWETIPGDEPLSFDPRSSNEEPCVVFVTLPWMKNPSPNSNYANWRNESRLSLWGHDTLIRAKRYADEIFQSALSNDV
ncbi:hypothetical protein TNCV_1726121 [Trichonephila clavipes]|nr:hypothetical protein TNCV_1726121 [Trichonephila clavipes]